VSGDGSSSGRPVVVASAGIGMVGVSYGMARYGLGLLAPDIRATFRLSSGSLGLLSAASYITYIAASIVAAAMVVRIGARLVVTGAGLLATVGMLIAASAGSAGVLFAGLLVAGASAGLAFPPFSDIAGCLAPSSRNRVMAAINAGTGWGVALAAPVALLAGHGWRLAWLSFAILAALATIWAAAVLPAGRPESGGPAVMTTRSGPGALRPRRLLTASLLVGLASSVYWTFGVDYVRTDGGLTSTQSRLFLAAVGVASVAGTLSAQLIERLGARALFVIAAVAEAVSLLLLGAVPDRPATVVASAVLFGAAYNTVVAATVIWSARLHAHRPSRGLAAIMTMQAIGLLVGPPILGAVADQTGFLVVFAAAAALLIATTMLAPAREPRAGGTTAAGQLKPAAAAACAACACGVPAAGPRGGR
jgi:predicted MFS family arabinose efflux permease